MSASAIPRTVWDFSADFKKFFVVTEP